jgi:AcrR family transcriptional regulator
LARRSSATVRALLLGAAQELFGEHGYEQVSTREVAHRAGVTQALLFRHFGTKANLFAEAVYQPFHLFVTEYIAKWTETGHGNSTSLSDTEAFVGGLYDLLLVNRRLLATVTLQAGDESAEAPERVATSLGTIFDRLGREIVLDSEVRGTATIDVKYAVRFAFALIYGMTMLDPMLFPGDETHPDRQELTRVMAGFVLRGSTVEEAK